MNVLIEFGSGAEDFDDEVYTDLLDFISVDQCVLIHHNKDLLSSRRINKYVSHAIFATPLLTGDYKEAIEQIGEGSPLDADLLNKMAPYENEILVMLLRWSNGEYTDMWHDYCQHLRFWNHVLDSYRIDAYFTTELVHAGYNYVIYLLCKLKGIAYFSTERISYPDHLHIAVDIHEQLPFFMEEYNVIYNYYKDRDIKEIELRSDMLEMYNFYTGEKDRTPSYMSSKIIPQRSKWARWLYDNFVLCRWLYDVYRKNNYFGVYIRELFCRISFFVNTGIRLFSFSSETNEMFVKYCSGSSVFRESATFLSYYRRKAENVDYSCNYIYIPLHYQPEQSTSPLGGKFVDQLLMVKMLSYYLPEGWKLYIKEHPSFENASPRFRATWRSKRFYDELDHIPNVTLVDFSEDTYKLMDNSVAVAVITGTAGLEAITKGKKCLMFGYSYLQYAPNVITVRSNDDCKNAMELLEKGIENKDIDKKIKAYFKTLEEYLFEGNLVWYDADYRTNYERDREKSKKNIVNAYLKELKRICGNELL